MDNTYVSDQISTGFLEYLKVSYTARVPSNTPLLAWFMGAGIMTFLLFSQPLHTVWAPCNHRSVLYTNEWRPLLSSGSAGFSVKVHRDSIMRFFYFVFSSNNFSWSRRHAKEWLWIYSNFKKFFKFVIDSPVFSLLGCQLEFFRFWNYFQHKAHVIIH